MKLPAPLRRLVRRLRGLSSAPSISADELAQACERESVLVLALGEIDDALPGEQRRADLADLAAALEGVDRERLIVTHCP